MEELFLDFLRAEAVACLCFALFLWMIKTPDGEIYEPYRRSKRLLALGYFVMSANMGYWSVCYHGRWSQPEITDIYFDVVAIYLLYIVFRYAFCNLLDHHYLTRKRISVDLARWLCVIGVCALSMMEIFDGVRKWIAMAVSFSLLEYILTFLYRFRKLYLDTDKVLANYYADDKRRFVAWTNRYILLMVIYGLLAFASVFEGVVFNFCFQLYALVLNFFVVIDFLNYSHTYGEIETAYFEWEEKMRMDRRQTMERNDVSMVLESKLKIWLAEEKFTDPAVNLESLASFVGTNRPYLSRFLNDIYGVTFSEWVSANRVRKAKQIMMSHPKEKMEEVAYRSGFSSLSYFSKVFSRAEGMSPTRWRDTNAL